MIIKIGKTIQPFTTQEVVESGLAFPSSYARIGQEEECVQMSCNLTHFEAIEKAKESEWFFLLDEHCDAKENFSLPEFPNGCSVLNLTPNLGGKPPEKINSAFVFGGWAVLIKKEAYKELLERLSQMVPLTTVYSIEGETIKPYIVGVNFLRLDKCKRKAIL